MEWIDLYGEKVQAKITKHRKIVYNKCTFQLHPEENRVIECIRYPFLTEIYPLLLLPFEMDISNGDKKEALRVLKLNFSEQAETLKKYFPDKYLEIDTFIRNKEYTL